MRRYLLATLVTLLLASASFAQVPQTLSYQGLLTDDQSRPVPDGTYELTISLYDADSGGAALWTETHEATLSGGVFSLVLGSFTPLTLAFDRPYWLGTAVDGATELAPRVALTASPYSLNSKGTVAEPEAGQSLAVREASGATAHLFSPDGSALHTGAVVIEGGLVVGDTTIALPDSLTAGGKKSQALPLIGARSSGSIVGMIGSSVDGVGVYGKSTAGRGVRGESRTGNGVYGTSIESAGARGTSTRGDGVSGTSASGTGVSGTSTNGAGATGRSTSGIGVRGESDTSFGLFGQAKAGVGVAGVSTASPGVLGASTSGPGIAGIGGTGPAVAGLAGTGLAGEFTGPVEVLGSDGTLKIENVPEDAENPRVLVWGSDFVVKWRTLSLGGDALWSLLGGAVSTNNPVHINNTGGQVVAAIGDPGLTLVGVEARLTDVEGSTLAGLGIDFDGERQIGVFGKADGPNGLAGRFEGDVEIVGDVLVDGTSHHTELGTFPRGIEIPLDNGNTAAVRPGEGWSIKSGDTFVAHNDPNGNAFFSGTLQAGTKNFKIDHPLAPTERYLQHVSVESPDMMTIYNGHVITDAAGFATVTLPDYFEALNREFRYQLTVVGQFAQAIVAEKIRANAFVIRTDQPDVEVSWQVTGIRHDPFAERFRVPVEVEKPPHERGTYLHPDAYGIATAPAAGQ